MTVFLNHHRVRLALHTLRGGRGQPLLLLHGLGEASPSAVPSVVQLWPGPIFALDFTGHGASSVPSGGGYTPEALMADADVALLRIGPCTVVGRGLGAYVALMLAGARASELRGVILCDGPGIAGGGDTPGAAMLEPIPDQAEGADPFALVELATDIRPPDYAAGFVALATRGSPLAAPITIAADARPGWLAAAEKLPGVRVAGLTEALEAYGSAEPVR